MKSGIFTRAMLCAVFITTQTAQAQVAEVRGGLTEFDERSLNIKGLTSGQANENSAAVNAEVIFEEPKILKWALSPQPYINGTLNLDGNTSFGGAGLLWRQNLGKKFYADFAFGGVIHDGTKDILFSDIADEITTDNANDIFAEIDRRFETEIEFGSRLLFREQVTLGIRVNDSWATEVFYEHLSNARLSENGENDGVNNLGVKVARKF